MKKLLLFLVILGLALFSTPAGACMLVTDIDPIGFQDNHTGAYWVDDDYNDGFATNLNSAGEAIETGWLYWGLLNETVPITYYDRWQAGDEFAVEQQNISIDTSAIFDWEYAIVKWGNYSVAYYDDNGSDILIHPTGFGFGEATQTGSHITFFNAQPIHEPATMLLLGSGLIGLGVLGRKKLFKKS